MGSPYLIVYIFMVYIATRNVLYFLLGAIGGSAAAVFAYQFFAHVQVREAANANQDRTHSKGNAKFFRYVLTTLIMFFTIEGLYIIGQDEGAKSVRRKKENPGKSVPYKKATRRAEEDE